MAFKRVIEGVVEFY
jgi:hypothetical protein